MSKRWANLVRDRREESAECADLSGLAHVFDAVLAGLRVPGDFSSEVIAEAQAVTGNAALPARDETAAPAVTVVSLGARGLDKELHTERGGRGHRVCCAGGVPAFVRPGGELGIEPEATTTPASMVVCRDDDARDRGRSVRTRNNVAAPARRPHWRGGLRAHRPHTPVSDGVGQGLPVMDEIMTGWDRLTEADRRACPDAVNAITSRHRVGETFDASIVGLTTSVGLVQVSVSTAWPRWLGGLGGRREHGQVQGERCCQPVSAVPEGRR
jgi:hypothetical protein